MSSSASLKVVDFVNKTMIPDTLAIAPYYLRALPRSAAA